MTQVTKKAYEVKHLDPLGSLDIAELAQRRGELAVSIYLRTQRKPLESEKAMIELKVLLEHALEELVEDGLGHSEAHAFVEPAAKLIDDDVFWRFQGSSLALFLSGGFFRSYRLPVEVPENYAVAGSFWVSPLLKTLQRGGDFLLLALSKASVTLYRGSPNGLKEVAIEGLPRSIDEALAYEDPESELSSHSGGPRRAGTRNLIFSGQGLGQEVTKEAEERYVAKVAKALESFLANETNPLVTAGVSNYHAMLQEALRYPNLINARIEGSPEHMEPAQLHERALTLLEDTFSLARRAAIENYAALAGTGATTSDLAEIVAAAKSGVLRSLLLSSTEPIWGRIASETAVVTIVDTPMGDSQDLVSMAVGDALASGAEVHLVSAESIGANPIAAVLRY